MTRFIPSYISSWRSQEQLLEQPNTKTGVADALAVERGATGPSVDPSHARLFAALPRDCRDAAAVLNQGCACLVLDHAQLDAALAEDGGPFMNDLRNSHPYLFADSLLFVSDEHLQRMAALVAAVDYVVQLPAYIERVLKHAPETAGFAPHARGVFLGYDFHEGRNGPQLIEINTNAGGGLLAARLISAQRTCCPELLDDKGRGGLMGTRCYEPEAVAADYLAMFREEWRLERGDAPLTRIAIVDENPKQQFLWPEFELFRRLFVKNGIDAVIADPAELVFSEGVLRHAGRVVDLVYNRLTDFSLTLPESSALRVAYLSGATVVTPHPRAHALYADKRNMMILRDEAWLAEHGVPEGMRRVLVDCIPEVREITPDNAVQFWSERRAWFFKPFAGYGSRATYRGEKLTKRVFEAISRGGYVAQALVPPSGRRATDARGGGELKADIRNYAYKDRVQLVSSRLYQGQTTNFRTPGGGFASVFAVRCREATPSDGAAS